MAYTPNNSVVYLSAYSGCISGLGAEGKYLNDPVSGDQFGYARMANAFAKEVDVVWQQQVAAVPDSLQADTIAAISEAVWENRSPLIGTDPYNAGNYYGVACGVVALVLEGSLVVASEGVVPPAAGGGSSILSGTWVNLTSADSPYSWDPTVHQKILATAEADITITMTAAPADGTILAISTVTGNVFVVAPAGWNIFDPTTYSFLATAHLSAGAMLLCQAIVSTPASLAQYLVPLSAF